MSNATTPYWKRGKLKVRESGEMHGRSWLICRVMPDGEILDVIGPFATKERADRARLYLIEQGDS